MKRARPTSKQPAATKRTKTSSEHPFAASPAGDDRETPQRALRDVVHLLSLLRPNQRLSNLHIYDPFYCDGSIKHRLHLLGCTSVTNNPVDFYQTIRDSVVPPHDIFLTNPPYSSNHIRASLEFCCGKNKKNKKNKKVLWMMLLPSNVYLRDWYQSVVSKPGSVPPLMLCPHEKYSFVVPTSIIKGGESGSGGGGGGGSGSGSGGGQESEGHVPYATMWYIGGLEMKEREDVLARWKEGSDGSKSKSMHPALRETTLAGTSEDLPRRVRKAEKYYKKKTKKKKKKKKSMGNNK